LREGEGRLTGGETPSEKEKFLKKESLHKKSACPEKFKEVGENRPKE